MLAWCEGQNSRERKSVGADVAVHGVVIQDDRTSEQGGSAGSLQRGHQIASFFCVPNRIRHGPRHWINGKRHTTGETVGGVSDRLCLSRMAFAATLQVLSEQSKGDRNLSIGIQ